MLDITSKKPTDHNTPAMYVLISSKPTRNFRSINKRKRDALKGHRLIHQRRSVTLMTTSGKR